jgi:transcriptional antiterminator Rof (Rho-off)
MINHNKVDGTAAVVVAADTITRNKQELILLLQEERTTTTLRLLAVLLLLAMMHLDTAALLLVGMTHQVLVLGTVLKQVLLQVVGIMTPTRSKVEEHRELTRVTAHIRCD